MNYRRGLFRVWVVGTLGWWVHCFTISAFACERFNPGPWCQYRTDLGAFIVALLWPAVAFVVGWIVLWAIRGFAKCEILHGCF